MKIRREGADNFFKSYADATTRCFLGLSSGEGGGREDETGEPY